VKLGGIFRRNARRLGRDRKRREKKQHGLKRACLFGGALEAVGLYFCRSLYWFAP
jgi:hypothetical protein